MFNSIDLQSKYLGLFCSEEPNEDEVHDGDERLPKAMRNAKQVKSKKQKPR